MSETTVLVTGAGGPAGVAVIRALLPVARVVAADADPSAVGLRLAHDAASLPRADTPGFGAAVAALAERTGATALLCTVAEELPALAAERDRFTAVGLRTWLPAPGAVLACTDKWRFAQRCAAAGVPAPATGLGSADGVRGPWVVKPRHGRGSRDVVLADDEPALREALRRHPGALVQTRIDGREFTVDALVDRDGTLAAAVPRWRLETKAGISTKGLTFSGDAVTAAVAATLAAVGLDGPANVQGFVEPDGGVVVIEVNPRFSGGLPLSLAAGADLVGQYLRGVLGQPLQRDRLRHRDGVLMLRHHVEVFEDTMGGAA